MYQPKIFGQALSTSKGHPFMSEGRTKTGKNQHRLVWTR